MEERGGGGGGGGGGGELIKICAGGCYDFYISAFTGNG